jgi:hypothetical protein
VLCGELQLVGFDNRLQFLQVVVGLVPVAAQDVLSELCRRRMLKTAARFLHQHLCGAIETNELQVLPNQPDNVAICLVELNTLDWLQVVVVVCVMGDTVRCAVRGLLVTVHVVRLRSVHVFLVHFYETKVPLGGDGMRE